MKGTRYRILVAEDSFLLVTLLQDVFDDLGWEMVGPATRLADALQLAQHGTFDAALLDINLDGTMSWEAAILIKERGIPFAFGTGYDVNVSLPDALTGIRVVAKPYQLKELQRTMQEIITAGSASSNLVAAASPGPSVPDARA